MAVIQYISPTQPVAAIDGFVPYKNAQQIAMRSRAYPKRVTSSRAAATRNIISQLSIFWESPVSNSQRIAWGSYAFNTPLTNAWGAPRYIRGYAHYMRSNRPRLQFGLPRIDTGPTTAGLPTYTLYGFGLDNPATTVKVFFDGSESWTASNGAYLLIWIGYATRSTRNLPTEVYQPLGYIAGSSSSPATSPAAFTLPPSLSPVHARIFLRASLSLADGRLSL